MGREFTLSLWGGVRGLTTTLMAESRTWFGPEDDDANHDLAVMFHKVGGKQSNRYEEYYHHASIPPFEICYESLNFNHNVK